MSYCYQDGKTALQLAQERGHTEVVDLLKRDFDQELTRMGTSLLLYFLIITLHITL